MSDTHGFGHPPKDAKTDQYAGGASDSESDDDEEYTSATEHAEDQDGDTPYYDRPENVYIDDGGIYKGKAKVADPGDDFFPKQYYANPFYEKDLGKFFPEGWEPNSRYEEALRKVKVLFEREKNIPEMLSGVSPLHPFLEVGGGLRVQVPLPEDMAELNTLIGIVLKKSKDAWKLSWRGFRTARDARGGETLPNRSQIIAMRPGIRKKRVMYQDDFSRDSWEETNRELLLWDDPAGASVGRGEGCPDLVCLICSIIYQRSDMIGYGGSRGRYPAHVVRRLIDGHAYPNRDNSRTVFAFTIDPEDGYPYGFYSGVITNSNIDLSKFNPDRKKIEARVPSILLNYTFCVDASSEGGSSTLLLRAALTAYTSKYITGLPTNFHYMAVHTDKCAAAKSTGSKLKQYSSGIGNTIYSGIADTCFEFINRNAGRGQVKEKVNVKGSFPGVVLLDESTVPPFDEGEEVPRPGDRFYKDIYPAYRELVREKTGNTVSERLHNGGVVFDQAPQMPSLKSILQIARDFGIAKTETDEALVQKLTDWMTGSDCLSFMDRRGVPQESALLKKLDEDKTDLVVAPEFDINSSESHSRLNKRCSFLQNVGGDLDEFLRQIAQTVRYWAKVGNTGNFYWTANEMIGQFSDDVVIRRLTDYGFFLVGEVGKGKELDQRAQAYLKQIDVKDVTKVTATSFNLRINEKPVKIALDGLPEDCIQLTELITWSAKLTEED